MFRFDVAYKLTLHTFKMSILVHLLLYFTTSSRFKVLEIKKTVLKILSE